MVIGNSEGVGGEGSQRPKFFKESMKLNWNFQRGGVGVTVRNHPRGRYGYFLEPHNSALKISDCTGDESYYQYQVTLN